MDAFDVSTGEPSTTTTNVLPGEEVVNDESSWVIETNTATEEPPIGDNPFADQEQIEMVPLTTQDELANDSEPEEQQIEDHSSYDIFSQEIWTPVQAVLKKREEEIAAKDAEEAQKISTLRDQAKTDLEKWHRERERQLEQKHSNLRSTQDHVEKSSPSETSSKPICDWSKVMRLIDLTDGKQMSKSKRDLTRMKECIFNAKRTAEKKELNNGN